jgi:hypothetical protein
MSDIERELGDELEPDIELPADGDGDDGEGDDDESETETEPASASAEPDALSLAVARDKEWFRVGKYLAKNLGDIEGDDAILYHECFLCHSFGTPGFIRMEPLSPEVVSTLNTWQGLRPADELQADAHSRVCEECDGEGLVRMPSKVAGQTELPCVTCHALGWLGTDEKRGYLGSPIGNGAAPALVTAPGALEAIGAPDEPEPLEVQALREQGYLVTKLPQFTA